MFLAIVKTYSTIGSCHLIQLSNENLVPFDIVVDDWCVAFDNPWPSNSINRRTEWHERGIIPNEHLASGTDEPWSTWRSLNRLRVQKGSCRAMMKMWKLSHTDVCDCGERQTMSHLMTCGDAPNCTWADLAIPTLAVVNCAKHWEESI